MFERYTEKARRTIFFARYEASQFGSPYIETEHLLLGLLHENKVLSVRFLKERDGESLRREIEARAPVRDKVSTSVDLPLTNETKRVLMLAADEADRLQHRHIGTEHLFLGLLAEKDCLAANLLRERGVTLESAREMIATEVPEGMRSQQGQLSAAGRRSQTIVVHEHERQVESIRTRVMPYRKFHWEKKNWTAQDVVVRHGYGTFSFDLSLAGTTPELELAKGGWKEDECVVCGWKLSDQQGPEHAVGFTNGRDWICEECYEKFWARPDFLGGRFSALT
jgi:hypothetical protein